VAVQDVPGHGHEHGGNAVLGTITSAGPPLTLTTDGFKEELAMVGQNVDVYNAALTTNRGTGTITAIDRVAHTITLNANPGGTIATDLLVISGLTAPLTNQSSLFGVQYISPMPPAENLDETSTAPRSRSGDTCPGERELFGHNHRMVRGALQPHPHQQGR